MARNNIRESIRNLFVKSENSGATDAEKLEALLLAQRLLIQHNLSMQDISDSTMTKEQKAYRDNPEVVEKPLTNFVKLKFWEVELVKIIAENFRCKWYKSATFNKKRRIIILGLKEDVQIAREVYDFACKSIMYHVNLYVDQRLFDGYPSNRSVPLRNSYIRGYLEGLKTKFDEQVETQGFELALITHELVEQAYKDLKLVKGAGWNIKVSGDIDAKAKGYEDGKNFNYGADKLDKGAERIE